MVTRKGPRGLGKAKVKFSTIARRLKGFSIVGLGGISWDPPTDEREIVRKLVAFLEDRRVLYVSYHLEVLDQVTHSLLEVRQELTKSIQALPDGSQAADALRAMRAACRRFLDEQHPDFRNLHPRHSRIDGDPGFFVALGELRALFGIQIAALASRYKFDVGPELAAILPPESE